MTNQMMPRAGAGCGAMFAVALIAGSSGSADGNYVLALAALTLFLPFLAYLCSLLRQADGDHGWLAPTALAAGITAVAVMLASVPPQTAANHLAGGAAHSAVQDIANVATVTAMYPLALLFAVIAVVTPRTRVLPRWLGYGAALTAAALAVNAGFINVAVTPALLLAAAWTLAASVILFAKAKSRATHITPSTAPAAR